MTFDLIIPTYRPGEEFAELLRAVKVQTERPRNVIVINTERSLWKKEFEEILPFTPVHIKKREFDHGGTRRMAADMVTSEFFICMTQDAKPRDGRLFEKLLSAFEDERTAIVYARQETDGKAGRIERFTREFNYPKERAVKAKEDEKRLGIKTWFCSDVCAAYRKKYYDEAGGFVKRTIFNEDMLMAAAVMEKGYQVVYEAEARVLHYHEYGLAEQFRRNFDLGVSHREYEAIFSRVSSEKEGGKLVRKTALHLLKTGRCHLLPKLVLISAAKFLGYRLGKRYDRLPGNMVLKCAMNKGYFK